jgi:O-antigen/teichoic acid export membrane protein
MSGLRLAPFDAAGSFRPLEGAGELRRLAVQGAGATVFSGGVVLLVQIVGTVVLARLLAPRDFGVVAMVTTVSLFLSNFGLNGFTEAVLQREEINHALASNLFWINLTVCVVLTIGFAEAGSLLARFYRDPLVRPVATWVSLTIVFTSVSVIHLALLKRAMRFPAASANSIVARCASLAVSIILGLAGWGYWALVAGAVALPLAQSVGGWYLCRWVPGLPRRAVGTGSMVRFAMSVYGSFSLGFFTQNMDNLLVGWRFGAPALGFYKKAYDLFALSGSQLTAPLTNVAVSALSRVKQGSLEYRRHILSALALMAFVGMGVGADLTLVGKDVIRLLLGPKWGESGSIFAFFGPGIGIMVLYYSYGWIHLSIGRADRRLRWAAIEVTVTGLLFLLALPWGPKGIAAAWTASFWILTLPAFWYAGRPIRLGIGAVVAAVWKYFLASLLAGCTCFVIVQKFPPLLEMAGPMGAFTRLVTISALCGSLYLGAVILLYRGYEPLLQVAHLLRDMLPRYRTRGRPLIDRGAVAELATAREEDCVTSAS